MQQLSSTSNVALITDYAQLKSAFLENKSWDAQYRLIIQLGKTLPVLLDEIKIPDNEVAGCESIAWLKVSQQNGVYDFKMDSDTRVVKGLMKIIWLIFQGKNQAQIQSIDCHALFSELGLLNHLSPSRANGLFAIINTIKRS